MVVHSSRFSSFLNGWITFVETHSRIVGALMMREIITRYGRKGIGFLWLVAEPLMFCSGVLLMWSVLKPEYEHGVRVGPFIMTGYMSLLLFRHIVSYNTMAVQANVGLLYHKIIKPIHIYTSRSIMEFVGASVAFIIVYLFLALFGQVGAPADVLSVYGGWMLLAWMSIGVALIFSSLAIEHEVMERIVPVIMYLMIPLSGAFVMAAWLPDAYRSAYLLVPFPNAVEMIRAGVFGEFVPTYYNFGYAAAWAAGLTLVGLLNISRARRRLEIE